VQTVPLRERRGQFPGVTGNEGVGCVHSSMVMFTWQNPDGAEKMP
jgi:hypothetical protein